MSTRHESPQRTHFSSHFSKAVDTSRFRGRPSISGGLWKSMPMPMMERSEIYRVKQKRGTHRLVRHILSEEENRSLCHFALTTLMRGAQRTRNLKPMIVLIKVLFPDPLGPKRTCVSPGYTHRFTPFSTSFPAISTWRSTTFNTGSLSDFRGEQQTWLVIHDRKEKVGSSALKPLHATDWRIPLFSMSLRTHPAILLRPSDA